MNLQEKYTQLFIAKENIEFILADIRQEWATANCPFKEGDFVTICGNFHYGKEGKINKITGWADDYSHIDAKGNTVITCDLHWKVHGEVYKLNGSAGKYCFEFTSRDYERYLKSKDCKLSKELINRIKEQK